MPSGGPQRRVGAGLPHGKTRRWVRIILAESLEISGRLPEYRAPRASLERFRPVLEDLQRGRCFYCERGIRGELDVDHFIAWRRYPLDLGSYRSRKEASSRIRRSGGER